MLCTPSRGRPSVCKAQTSVVSTASWAPPCRPSTTTSSLRASAIGTSKSVSFTSMLVRTRPPASRHILAATHSKAKCTSCTMMATEVKWTATSAVGHRQGESLLETTQEDHAEEVGGIVVSRLVGAAVSAAPAPAPAWERTSACTCSGILVNKSSRYRSSLALASCCQPDRTVPAEFRYAGLA